MGLSRACRASTRSWGGIPEYSFNLVAGEPGTGKTTLAQQILFADATPDRPALYFTVLGEPTLEMLRYQQQFSFFDVGAVGESIRFVNLSDLALEQALQRVLDRILQDWVRELGATRVVIDYLSGFEVELAATEAGEMRQSLYRMIATLTGPGVTVLMTAEVAEAFAPPRLTAPAVSFLTDDIVTQRFIELNGYIHSVIGVVKMRRGSHNRALRRYEITPEGLGMDVVLRGYDGIITGVPVQRGAVASPAFPGLTGRESAVLQSLMELRDATPEAVHGQTGIAEAELLPILERLAAMRYITESAQTGEKTYRDQAQQRDALREP
ncbi:MAG TPA: ATPase domain-containing protein [Longimicrobiales bacterium]|nr:ATPase domain-containing protein [Longimicrobiales bacterium]